MKANFLRGVTEPSLMAATARLDEATGILALDNPEAGHLELRPDAPDAIQVSLEVAANPDSKPNDVVSAQESVRRTAKNCIEQVAKLPCP